MVDTLVMELASSAEDDAIDALDFAEWAAQQAEVAVLDAIMPAPEQTNGRQPPAQADLGHCQKVTFGPARGAQAGASI
jgi:hypothetical protein